MTKPTKLKGHWSAEKFGDNSNPSWYNCDLSWIEVMAFALMRTKVVEKDKWHTVQYYIKLNSDGSFNLDMLRISNCKRRK